MPKHSAITSDSELHQPKGVASASDNTVYIADGAGSGSWDYVVDEASDGSFTDTPSKEITGLSSYSTVYLTVPFIESSSGTNHYVELQVGSSGGYTTSSRYYSYLWNWNDGAAQPFSADTSWTVARSYDTNLALYGEQTLIVMITNFNKPYYSIMSSHGNLDRAQTANSLIYTGCGFIREGTAYDRLRVTAPYSFDGTDFAVTGFVG